LKSRFNLRPFIKINEENKIPLIGHIAFGIIDRGTNLIQVRPSTHCPLSCIFCSTDAGPCSRRRMAEYVVEPGWLVSWFNQLAEYKGVWDIEAHIDTVGDPLVYRHLPSLIRQLHMNPRVKVISIQTHGALLSEKIINCLEEAGLSRINLSIDSLDPNLAKYLSGTPWYDIEKVKQLAEYIVQCTKIDLLLAPVWVPSVNDKDIPEIIEFALNIGAGKHWPPLGIQKYIPHKFGRKPRRVRPLSWRRFYKALRTWERKYGIKLVLRPEDFNIYKVKPLPPVFKINEKVVAEIVGRGWMKGEWIARAKNRIITIVDVPFSNPPIGRKIRVKIIQNKHNIYLARLYPKPW